MRVVAGSRMSGKLMDSATTLCYAQNDKHKDDSDIQFFAVNEFSVNGIRTGAPAEMWVALSLRGA
jgi:hypothetical protein